MADVHIIRRAGLGRVVVMRRHVAICFRLLCLTFSLVSLLLMNRYIMGQTLVTVFDSVCASCVVILVSLAYYCIGKLFCGCCWKRGSWRRGRKVMLLARSTEGSYIDFDQRPTEIVWGVPRLTLENVWILVYGVGFILFVGGYCLLGQHPVCLSCFGFAVSVLGVDELICPRMSLNKVYASIRSAVLLGCLVSLVLVSVEEANTLLVGFVESLDFYALGFGFCLPFVGQFLVVAVRESRHYSLGSVFEVCEFGLPFAAFLAVFHLCVAYGQQFQLDHARMVNGQPLETVFEINPLQAVYYIVAPILLCPTLLAYFNCAFEGAAIDTLISVNVVLCVHYLKSGEGTVLGIYGTACCGVAVLGRIISEYEIVMEAQRWNNNTSQQQLPDLSRDPVKQQELASEVVWQRAASQVI